MDDEQRYRARLTATLMLVLLPISILYALIPLQVDPIEVSQRGITPIVLLGFLTALFGYGLSRTSLYAWAARISIAYLMGVCYFEIFINPMQAVGLYRILIFAVLLGAMMLSPRLVVLIVVGNLAVGTLRLVTLAETMQLDFVYAMLLLNAASVLLLVFIYHRNHLENLRQSRLSQRAAAHRQLAEDYAKTNQQLQQALERLDRMYVALDREAHIAARAVDEAREAALKALHQKTEFVSNISHEIRTPLTGVMGTFELLGETHLQPEQLEYLELGRESAQKLMSLMGDLLDFTKLESGKVTLSQRPIDIRALYAEIKALLKPQWSRAHLGFSIDVDPLVPQRVIGDPERLRQILLNLAGNAIKFTHAGGVFMGAKLLEIEQDEALIEFSVSDTGIGIPKEQAERIFENLVQGDTSSSRRYGGAGLGLSIVRQLVALMDSEIKFSSQVGVGSTFKFSLRAKIADEISHEPVHPPARIEQSDLEPSALPPSDTQPSVLVVEDNAINREMLIHIFAAFGIQVAQAKDGESAVLAAQTHPFRLIMMDVKLPRMNGMDTTRLIRTIPQHAATPIIAMTASIMSDEKAQYLASGMNDVLSKPFSIADLRNMLQRWYPESLF